MSSSPLVNIDWLADHILDATCVVIDASWHMPSEQRDARVEYSTGHIPGAIYFDLDALSDHGTPLPHMLMAPDAFARAVGALGISADHTVVVYDSVGIFSAPRVWWNFLVYGARAVYVLNGGLPAWRAAGLPLEVGFVTRAPCEFIPKVTSSHIADIDHVAHALASAGQVLDARAKPRFEGTAPEPRAGLACGHMPGSKNLPWGTLLENGFMKAPQALREAFADAGVDIAKPMITTCGSGVSAAILTLALAVLGAPMGALYDGSWAQWGMLGQDGKPLRAVAMGEN